MKKLTILLVTTVATTALWASNVITYTAAEKYTKSALSEGQMIFGSAITSHEFANNTGTIICEGEITKIGNQAFYNCRDMISVTIPSSVTTIEEKAFYGCSGLASVTIPSSVTTIGDLAFDEVNNIVYNGSATGLPWGAKCTNGYADGYLVYSDSTKRILCGCSSAITGELIIPNSVRRMVDKIFAHCNGLTSVTIPSSIRKIGKSAFYGCFGLTSVTIPNSVTEIGDLAFYGCSGLATVSVPSSVKAIGKDAFYNVNNVAYYGSAAGSPWGAKCTNCYVEGYVVYKSSTKKVLCCCSNAITGDLIIPNSVKKIESNAFYACRGLTSVTIPNSVTEIGDLAFACCSGLTSATVPNSVKNMGKNVFLACSGLNKRENAIQPTKNDSAATMLEEDNVVYLICEKPAQFPGGEQAMRKFLSENVMYPAIARQNGIQGRVLCQFIVNKDGSISDVTVVRSVDPSLDREAIRLIKSMPKWQPGEQRGKLVRTKFTLPINFSL